MSSSVSILGLSAYYHDSAAALVCDGEIVAAAQEERFSRQKHDARFPSHAVAYCLETAGLRAENVDHVAFYDQPLLKFDRLLETYIAYAPLGFSLFRRGMPLWLRQKLYLPREMDRALGRRDAGRYVFTEHHESHAASAFFPSPFDEAAILTLDGVGEWATGTIGVGRGNRIELLHESRFPHSLGLLYSAFTYFTGFRVNAGEYKVMGLAPYGEPKYRDLILEKLIDLKEDGSFRMDMSYFAFCRRPVMTGRKFSRLFGGPPRKAESPITQREMDIAASIQAVTEEIMLRSARHAHALTGCRNLVLAGGVALNSVGNGRILREGPFDRLWVQPAAGDAGGALGAALFVWHQLLNRPREPQADDGQKGSLLGPSFSAASAKQYLDSVAAVYRTFDNEEDLLETVTDLLAAEKVVGFMNGRMEFGPRALGSRSILADARSPEMQSRINRQVKCRESFRPFAPSVLRENVHEYFEMRPDEDSPYMLLVADVRPDKRVACTGPMPEGLDKLAQIRSVVPAVTHVDFSARVQTVDAERHGRFCRLLERFAGKTGCPVLLNTSFNVRGEPIVCTPEDAYRCFMATGMDALVIDDLLLCKQDQPTAKPHPIAPDAARRPSRQCATGLFDARLRPSRSELRQFGYVALVAFGALALLVYWKNEFFGFSLGTRAPAVATALVVAGSVSALFSLIAPAANRPLYVALTVCTYPIGVLVSNVLLAAMYFGILTPLGLLFRLLGRDAMQRTLDRQATTYWVPRRKPDPSRSVETIPAEARSLQSARSRPALVTEFYTFIKHEKKWWLLPIVIILLALSALVLLSSTAAGPFIYPFL